MSKLSIAKILNKAGKVVGRILGSKCTVYRPINYLDPMADANEILPKYAAFLLDENFTKTVDYKFQVFNVEVDTTDVQPADIFYDGADTFVIISVRPREGCKAYITNNFVTVNRPTYTATSGQFAPSPLEIARELPVNMYCVKGASSMNHIPGKQSNGNKVDYEMRIYTNEPILLVGDQLVDSTGTKSIISSIEFGPLGYTVTSQSP